MEYYRQVTTLAEQAWRLLPSSGLQMEELSRIRHGPDEPYQDFISHLWPAVGRLVVEGEAGMILVKQLAFENAMMLVKRPFDPIEKRELWQIVLDCAVK
jgi:hypothetical protein